MRVRINSQGDGKKRIRLWLWLPNCLLTCAPAAWLVCKSLTYVPDRLSNYVGGLTYGNIRDLQKTLRQCRHALRGQPLLELHSHDNQHVTVRL